MTIFWNILSVIFSLYMLLILVRIVLSWIRGPFSGFGGPQSILQRITDPYLAFFAKFMKIQLGPFDLSPVLALFFLSLAINITQILAKGGIITIGFLLGFFLGSIWGLVDFLFLALIILLIVRLVLLFTHMGEGSSFWFTFDSYVKTIIARAASYFIKRPFSYKAALVVSIIILIIFKEGTRFLITYLVRLLEGLPL